MPYTDDGTAWRDDRTREARKLNDPYIVAAERFVSAVEHYLYDEDHPGYRNPDYLGWSIAQFDATKRSSGIPANYAEWSPDSEPPISVRPLSATRTLGDRKDERLLVSEDEVQRRAKEAAPAGTAKGKGR
jgi:hypothetical protein